jgi:hypothetical protein
MASSCRFYVIEIGDQLLYWRTSQLEAAMNFIAYLNSLFGLHLLVADPDPNPWVNGKG